MSYQKTIREMNKAQQRLEMYLPQSPLWQHCFDEITALHLAPLSYVVGMPLRTVSERIFEGHSGDIAWWYLFSQMLSSPLSDQQGTALSDYLAIRGWREKGDSRQYLQSLGSTELLLWEVTDADSYESIMVREFGTNKKPIRVRQFDRTASLTRYSCLAARLIHMRNHRQFDGLAILLDAEDVDLIGNAAALVEDGVRAWLEDRAEADSEEMITAVVDSERRQRLSTMVFCNWMAKEIIVNKDAQSKQSLLARCAQLRALTYTNPITVNTGKVTSVLDAFSVLQRNESSTWHWRADKHAPVLATVTLEDGKLVLSTPLVDIGRRAIPLLRIALGDMMEEGDLRIGSAER